MQVTLPKILLILFVFLAFVFVVGRSHAADSTKEKWEYKYELPNISSCANQDGSLVNTLNQLGSQGWEVISFGPIGSNFKAKTLFQDSQGTQVPLARAYAQLQETQTLPNGCLVLLKRRIE